MADACRWRRGSARGFTLVELPVVSKRKCAAFTLVELLVVIAIIGILVALLLPAIQAAREAARRASCMNNQKNIGIAILNHHEAKKTFPPGAIKETVCGTGSKFFSGWTREIMPFAEDQSLNDLYDPTINVIDTGTTPQALKVKQFRETLVPLYNCPSDFQPELTLPAGGPGTGVLFMTSSYRANAGRGDGYVTWYLYEDTPKTDNLTQYCDGSGIGSGMHKGWRGPMHAIATASVPANFYKLRLEKIKDVSDGTTKTLMLGEQTNQVKGRRSMWAYTWGNYVMSQPTPHAATLIGDLDRCVTLAAGYGESNRACHSGWFSNHPSGMIGALCDGSTRFISFDIDVNVFAAYGSIAGNENVISLD